MNTKQKLLTLALTAGLAGGASGAFIIDPTGNDSYDGETTINIPFTDPSNSLDAIATFVATGGTFNSNAGDFGIGDDQIDGTSEVITITFNKDVEFVSIDLGGVGSGSSDGASLTVASTVIDLFTGVSGFNGSSDVYTPSSPIALSTSGSIQLTGSSATSSFDLQSLTVSVIPEPNTFGALAGLLALGLAITRRRRS